MGVNHRKENEKYRAFKYKKLKKEQLIHFLMAEGISLCYNNLGKTQI